jgi:hypothetical protein
MVSEYLLGIEVNVYGWWLIFIENWWVCARLWWNWIMSHVGPWKSEWWFKDDSCYEMLVEVIVDWAM